MRKCGDCVHLWDKGPRYIGQRCGKGAVKQEKCEDARAASGDCGPEARYYETSPFQKERSNG